MIPKALRAFLGPIKALSPYHQAGLVILVALTPRSKNIRRLFADSLSHFRLIDRCFRSVILPLLALEVTMIFYALIIGSLSGLSANIMVGLITITSVSLFFMLNGTSQARSFIVMAYRQRHIYEAIKLASRDPSLYIGRLGDAGRLMTGLPGNVSRPLDGIMILGCLDDLIELSDIDIHTLTQHDNFNRYRQYHQYDEIENTGHLFGKAYGAIAEALWTQSRLASAVLSRVFPNRHPRVIRSDSGSLFYELFLHGDTIIGTLLPVLLMVMIFSVKHALVVAGAMLLFVAHKICRELMQNHAISPRTSSSTWKNLRSNLEPVLRGLIYDRKISLTKPQRTMIKDLLADFKDERPVSAWKLHRLLFLITNQVEKDHNADYVNELLFYVYWEHETGVEASPRVIQRTLFNSEVDDSIVAHSNAFMESLTPDTEEHDPNPVDQASLETVSGAPGDADIDAIDQSTSSTASSDEPVSGAPAEESSDDRQEQGQTESGNDDRAFLDAVSDRHNLDLASEAGNQPEPTDKTIEAAGTEQDPESADTSESTEDDEEAPPPVLDDYEEDEVGDIPEDEPDLDDLPTPEESDGHPNIDDQINKFLSEQGTDDAK